MDRKLKLKIYTQNQSMRYLYKSIKIIAIGKEQMLYEGKTKIVDKNNLLKHKNIISRFDASSISL